MREVRRMERLQLFEWEDQPWLPNALRDFVTDHLRYTFGNPAAEPLRRTIAEILLPPLQRSGAETIVDVCSGGGGPLPVVMPLLEAGVDRPLRAVLTDLYPNVRAFERLERTSRGAVHGERASISAFDVPARLGSFETVFTAFHHFDPVQAASLLADAAAKRRTIVVIEPFRRRDILLAGIGGFVRGVLLTPWVGRMSVARFLWTWPIPISAFVLGWDGAVSCLRAYSATSMRKLAEQAVPAGYRWSVGERPVEGSRLRLAITYLIGEPL